MHDDRLVVWVSTVVALAVVALAGYIVTRLGPGQPALAAGVLTAVAGMLAAVPAIIKALRGDRR